MKREVLENALKRFIPEPAVPLIATWIQEYNVHLHISHKRSSKLGDYMHPYQGKGHRISVNHDLNNYDFLVTLVHEFAHLTTWNKFKSAVQPHGSEWKTEYKVLMQPFIQLPVFPDDVKLALKKHFINPGASSCSDLTLQRVLNRYDKKKNDALLRVEQIPTGGKFRLLNDHVFQKGKLIRTRFECKDLETGRTYFVSALAECVIVDS
jgi:SprT protein